MGEDVAGGAWRLVRGYRLTLRILNAAIRPLARLGLAGRHTYVLTVRGRWTNRRYSTPVTLVERDGERWLVAPYGVTNWVKNARAAGKVELARAGRTEIVSLTELDPTESAPVLRDYVRDISVVRSFFDAGPDSPLEAFAKEAERHPVFRLGSLTLVRLRAELWR
jgi:deazaflavin-dependent oxidoreductase (nitroreductase family)